MALGNFTISVQDSVKCRQNNLEFIFPNETNMGESNETGKCRYISRPKWKLTDLIIMIIIMYIYHVLINALSTHMIHINLNMIFYTHVEHCPTQNNLHKVL